MGRTKPTSGSKWAALESPGAWVDAESELAAVLLRKRPEQRPHLPAGQLLLKQAARRKGHSTSGWPTGAPCPPQRLASRLGQGQLLATYFDSCQLRLSLGAQGTGTGYRKARGDLDVSTDLCTRPPGPGPSSPTPMPPLLPPRRGGGVCVMAFRFHAMQTPSPPLPLMVGDFTLLQ